MAVPVDWKDGLQGGHMQGCSLHSNQATHLIRSRKNSLLAKDKGVWERVCGVYVCPRIWNKMSKLFWLYFALIIKMSTNKNNSKNAETSEK